jgi:hypothetical protein
LFGISENRVIDTLPKNISAVMIAAGCKCSNFQNSFHAKKFWEITRRIENYDNTPINIFEKVPADKEKTYKIVWFDRPKGNHRSLENKDEVFGWINEIWNTWKHRWSETNLKINMKDKFHIVMHNSSMTVRDTQILLKDAFIMAGTHGAGLTNMLLAPEHISLLELHPETYDGSTHVLDCFSNVASQIGIIYAQICGETGSSQAGTIRFKKAHVYSGFFTIKTQIDNKFFG